MASKVPLIAAKATRYAGKALRAGTPFLASPSDARIMLAAKLATYDTRDQARSPAEVKAPPPNADADELATLRADYENLAGRKPHNFWKADRLRTEIDRLLEAQTAPATDTDEPPATE